jgi:hypothetical protein
MDTNLILANNQAAIDAIRKAGAQQLLVHKTASLQGKLY